MIGLVLNHLQHATANEAASQSNVFAGLSQSLYMHLNGLAQAGHGKIPFVGEAIAPAARLNVRVEFACHYVANRLFTRSAVKIEIIAEIRVVIERLHHRRRTLCSLQFVANGLKVYER